MSSAGYLMTSAFTTASAERLAQWQLVAAVYLGLGALSLAGVAFALVTLARASRHPQPDEERAGRERCG